MRGRVSRTVALIAAAGLLAGCATTVKPGQLALKYKSFRRPALQRTVRPEGWYWRFPWNALKTYDVTFQSQNEDVDILTADDLHVRTRVTVTFRPERDKLFELATMIGTDYYGPVVRPPFVTLVRSEFAKHRHNDLAKHSPTIESDVLAKLRDSVKGKHIEIDRVSIVHIEYDPEVTKAISAKIATEQAVATKELEVKVAEQDAEIARTRARGQADAARIGAEGQAKAQESINRTLTPAYLRYKAFDNPATRYYFVPVGKDGLPLIINAGGGG